MDPTIEPTTAKITAGLLDRKELAVQLNRSERTIIRYEHDGMPVIPLGMQRFYNPETVRAWLMEHERSRKAPKRGRPNRAQDREELSRHRRMRECPITANLSGVGGVSEPGERHRPHKLAAPKQP